jgi:hypothetical protein
MMPTNVPHFITIPRWFMSKKLDVYHKWEINGNVKQGEIEQYFSLSGFKQLKHKRILYVDFWLMEKHG